MTPIARATRRSLATLAIVSLALSATVANADDAWYVGIGGGLSQLVPDASNDLDVDEEIGNAATFIVGRDLDDTSSVQLQLHGLGTATFVDEQEADYYAADVSVLYRFLDSRDRSRSTAGVALYGRFGLGYMRRDTDVTLEDDAPVWFGAGAGLEFALGRNLAIRTEGLFFDTDAGAAYLSVVGRFGGARRASPRRAQDSPAPVPETMPMDPTSAPGTPASSDAIPPVAPAPADSAGMEATTAAPALLEDSPVPPAVPIPGSDDRDGDGVADADDVCLQSTAGYPVRSNGCAMFDGVLSGVTFVDGTAELLPGGTQQLDSLAGLLRQYPKSRIELHAHTDARGTERDQAILTRGRLRTVGTYLVGLGIQSNRLVLRSFGGSRPLDGGSVDANNRIEVQENTQ